MENSKKDSSLKKKKKTRRKFLIKDEKTVKDETDGVGSDEEPVSLEDDKDK